MLAMNCIHYMSPGCGLSCCLTMAEQFAFYAKNEPSLIKFCPLIQRYGEFISQQEEHHHIEEEEP